tara:strand:- start:14831 stop:15523 length:693 start_codon:yes stop_codon:yes gene_type:complete
MERFNSNNPKVFDGCNYYLMYRINNNDWECIFKPFVMSYDGEHLSGQYLSSSWFKQEIKENYKLDILVIKLPRRDSNFCPEEHLTIDMLRERLIEYENNTIYNMDYCDLDFVVAYRNCKPEYLNNVYDRIKENIVDNDNKISPLLEMAGYTENKTENNFISLKYEIICEDINWNENILYNSIITNTTTLDQPQLTRSDNSWNRYSVDEIENANEKYKKYITTPNFKIVMS